MTNYNAIFDRHFRAAAMLMNCNLRSVMKDAELFLAVLALAKELCTAHVEGHVEVDALIDALEEIRR